VSVLVYALVTLCVGDIVASDSTYPPDITITGTLPVIYIDTEFGEPIVSKKEYINATYWLDPMGMDGVEAIGSAESPLPLQIRGRGHSSWKGTKKPYKIKLGSKTSMLGMPANKHWALLKPSEHTIAGMELGKMLDMAWTPSLRPVELVLNGAYWGLYFLTETVRIGKNRVNIYEQEDLETDPEMISGGWLVEIDNYADECQIQLPECSRWRMTLRYHSPELLSDEQLQWLRMEFTRINKAIYANDKTSTDWEDHIDVESMARFFILQEVMDNPDGFSGSFYLHKDLGDGSKWIAGPAWDLLCYNREKTDYTFKMKVHYSFTPHWIGEIIKYDSFCKAVAKVWNEVYPDKLSEIYDYLDEVLLPLDLAWQTNYIRWNEVPPTTPDLSQTLKAALRRNMEWFDRHLPVGESGSLHELEEVDISAPTVVYTLQGTCVGSFNSEREATEHLKRGIYIINRKKVRID